MGRLVRRILLVLCLLLGTLEASLSALEAEYVSRRARAVVAAAGAVTRREKTVALRDYLRRHVKSQGYPQAGRGFLRPTAAEVLRSGRGWSGEATRTFICMADAVGVRAQRINLYGSVQHVVAEAELGPRDRVVVDCSVFNGAPIVPDLVPLDELMVRPEFEDYYTLNLRRLGMQWLVSRVHLSLGPLTYWTEQPHLLKATLWFFLAAALALAHVARRAFRAFLAKRGWLHSSSVAASAARGGSGETAQPPP